MKAFIALALLTIPTANAATLIKADRMPGFERMPQHREFVLDSSGKMTLTIEGFRDQKKEVEVLGQLSKKVVARIATRIDELAEKSELVDPRKGEPMCMDAPSFSVSVFKGEKEIVIERRAGCHSAQINDYGVDELTGMANLFLNF